MGIAPEYESDQINVTAYQIARVIEYRSFVPHTVTHALRVGPAAPTAGIKVITQVPGKVARPFTLLCNPLRKAEIYKRIKRTM